MIINSVEKGGLKAHTNENKNANCIYYEQNITIFVSNPICIKLKRLFQKVHCVDLTFMKTTYT